MKSISGADGAQAVGGERREMAGPAFDRLFDECVLIVAPVGNDAAAMGALLEEEGFETRICSGSTECAGRIVDGAGAVVLTEEAIEVSQMPELLDALQTQPAWSEIPVIILTSGGESRLARLLNVAAPAARAVTLLERPVSKSTFVRCLQVALSSRRRQYQVRDLLEAQARLAAIVTSSDDAIVSKTLEGIVTTWNAGAERMFGYSAAEMTGSPILKVIPAELQGEESVILARLKRGERIEHYETIRMAKDGRRIPVSLTISPIRSGDGKLMGASKIVRDITGRRAAEEGMRLAKEQAEAASRAKDNFLAALSHELRTPLTPVLMTAATLREDERLPEDVRAQLGMIERNVLLEARLIDDLLDLSRITHGKLALRSEPCDAHSIIALVIEIIRAEAREKEVEILLELSARHCRVVGDPARLQQVFWNLLRNAVKFTPPGGHIHIRSHDVASGGDPRFRIVVSDDGIGLDPDVAERIFEPFEQVGPSKTSTRGLGLGLAIARAIVDMHSGSIRAESPGPGKGSTFTVELPASISLENEPGVSMGLQPGAANPAPAVEPGRGMRLLVVEDHEPTLQVLTRLLTRDGHEVAGASTLAAARHAAAANRFDAVISDLGLPDGSGVELMMELRDQYGMRGIVLSGYGMEDDLRRSREAGFSAHLVKPIDVHDLRRALRQLFIDDWLV